MYGNNIFVVQGQIYMLNPARSDKIEKVIDVLSGNFAAAALLPTNKNICVVKQIAVEIQFLVMSCLV